MTVGGMGFIPERLLMMMMMMMVYINIECTHLICMCVLVGPTRKKTGPSASNDPWVRSGPLARSGWCTELCMYVELGQSGTECIDASASPWDTISGRTV